MAVGKSRCPVFSALVEVGNGRNQTSFSLAQSSFNSGSSQFFPKRDWRRQEGVRVDLGTCDPKLYTSPERKGFFQKAIRAASPWTTFPPLRCVYSTPVKWL